VIYVITIGVLGSRGKSAVAEIIQGELKKQGKNICIIGTNQESSELFFEIFQDDVEYVIIAVSREDILYKRIDKIKFDILIQTAKEKESSELIDEMQNIINNIKENGYVIFNSDSIQKINFQCDKVYPITYGLNERTTVTASSIDDLQKLCFSYCLQRTVLNIADEVVQPFDKPIVVNGLYEDINYYLAAYTCLLVLGYNF
jgi:UDP-N-acetylmuramyl tripeptide synthase